MPVYNREQYIKKAIESLIEQDFKDWELVIVDDGSTDQTASIIESFADPRIKYHYQKNAGEYVATNNGFKLTKGKFITWLHSDDILPPHSLSNRYNFFQKNINCDFIHADIIKIDKDGKKIKEIRGSDLSAAEIFKKYCIEYYNSLLQKNIKSWVHHLTLLIKRDFFQSVGYMDEKLKHAGDFDWLLRALKISPNIKHLNKVVYYYRSHSGTKRVTDAKIVDKNLVVKNILKKHCGDKCVF